MSRPGARFIDARSPWRIVRWGAVAALLIAVALLAANVGASVVAGGHLGLIPHHLASTIAFSAPPPPPGRALTAIPPHAG
jgi:hypothetical protein